MKLRRRIARRRGSDSRWQTWWPILVYLGGLIGAVISLYFGISSRLTVQETLFSERTNNMKAQIETLQRNVEGLERYIVELHQQEGRPR